MMRRWGPLFLLLPLLLVGLWLWWGARREEAARRAAGLSLAAQALSRGDLVQGQGAVAPTCVTLWQGHWVRLSLAPWCPSPPGWPRRRPLAFGEVLEVYAAVDGRPYRLSFYRVRLPSSPAGVGRTRLSGEGGGGGVPAFLPPGSRWTGVEAPVFAVPCSLPRPDGCGAPPRYPQPSLPPLLPFYPSLGRPGEAAALARRGGRHLGEEAWVRLSGSVLQVEGPGGRRSLPLPKGGVVYARRLVVLGGRAGVAVTLAGEEVALRGEVGGRRLGVLAEGSLHLYGAKVEGHLLARQGEVVGEGEVVGTLASFGPQAPGVRVVFRPGPPPPGWPRWPGGVMVLPLEVVPWPKARRP